MEALRGRFGSGLSWLRSHGTSFNSSLLLDSFSIPFTDSQFSISSDSAERRPLQPDERVIYVDTNGRELSQGEVEEYNRANFNESPWGFVASRYALTLGIMVSRVFYADYTTSSLADFLAAFVLPSSPRQSL